MTSVAKFSPADFFKIYGWAVLIIVSLLAMMFYFNIFDTSQVECQFSGAFGCTGNVAMVNETHISFFLEKQLNSQIVAIRIDPSFITFSSKQSCTDIFVHPIIDRFEEEISVDNVLEDNSQVRILLECLNGTFARSNSVDIIGSYQIRDSEIIQSFEGYILA